MKKTSLVTATFCLLAATALHAAETTSTRGSFPFKNGDSVVFLGDSITDQRLYTTYLETYLLTRFPNWSLKFRNAGWGGDTAWFGARGLPPRQALQRDVLDLKPTVVTIDYGMNDFGYGAFKQNLYDAHVAGETAIVQQLKAAKIRPIVLTPSPMEKKDQGNNFEGLNETLGLFAAADAAIAERENVPFADQFTPYNEAVNRLRAINPALRITDDVIHPQHAGHLLMASYILSGLNAPSLVSSASIDARRGSVRSTVDARITNVVRRADGVSFQRLDKALVFPIETAARPALQVAPIADLINRYMVQVTNLQPGSYSISVNGTLVTRASADELSHGVNLGYYESPLTEAGAKIMGHVRRKNDVYWVSWSSVQIGPLPEAEKQTQIQAYAKEIVAEEAKIEALRKPAVFQFDIKRAIMPAALAVTPAKP